MKKLLAAILLLVYLSATTGIVINSHYCMKRLVSVKLFETSAKQCGQCGMEMHDNPGCCHDDTRYIKLVQDQVKVPGIEFELTAFKPSTAGHLAPWELSLPVIGLEKNYAYHSPPLRSEQDLYLQQRVFRI